MGFNSGFKGLTVLLSVGPVVQWAAWLNKANLLLTSIRIKSNHDFLLALAWEDV